MRMNILNIIAVQTGYMVVYEEIKRRLRIRALENEVWDRNVFKFLAAGFAKGVVSCATILFETRCTY